MRTHPNVIKQYFCTFIRKWVLVVQTDNKTVSNPSGVMEFVDRSLSSCYLQAIRLSHVPY